VCVCKRRDLAGKTKQIVQEISSARERDNERACTHVHERECMCVRKMQDGKKQESQCVRGVRTIELSRNRCCRCLLLLPHAARRLL